MLDCCRPTRCPWHGLRGRSDIRHAAVLTLKIKTDSAAIEDMDGRTPLLLLPGLLNDAELWAAQVRDLTDIADPHVADLTLDDSVGAMAARALASAPPRFALAGLSMGGYVAFEILRRSPERVTRLALLDTSAAADTPARAARRRSAMDSLRLGRFVGVTSRLLPQLVHADHVTGPVGDAVRAMAARVGGEAFLRQQHAILTRPDSVALLASIEVPTLVAVGDSDQLTPPSEARIIRDGVADAVFHCFERCGHLPPLEAPADVSRTLRTWLRSARSITRARRWSG